MPFVDAGVEHGGSRPAFRRLVNTLRAGSPPSLPTVVMVVELSRLIRSSSEKRDVDALLDAGRADIFSEREGVDTSQQGGRERYEQVSGLLALAYDGAQPPTGSTRAALVDAYVKQCLGPWLALHGTLASDAVTALEDVRARLRSLARAWGTPAARSLLGAYRELADGHEPAELPPFARELAIVGVRNSDLETLHLSGSIMQTDWRVITQAAAYVLHAFDTLPSGDLEADRDPFAGVALASPAAAAAFEALASLNRGDVASWDASLVGTGDPFSLKVALVPVTEDGADVLHAMDTRVPRRFMVAFFDENKPKDVLVLPSFKHISRNVTKLFPVIEEAMRRDMLVVTNNCAIKAGQVTRRERWVGYNNLDVGWYIDLSDLAVDGMLRRPGRNEPCPCESGKKYKRCCGS